MRLFISLVVLLPVAAYGDDGSVKDVLSPVLSILTLILFTGGVALISVGITNLFFRNSLLQRELSKVESEIEERYRESFSIELSDSAVRNLKELEELERRVEELEREV